MSGTAPTFAPSLGSLAASSVFIRDERGVLALRGAAAPAGARDLFREVCGVVDVGGLPLAWLSSAGGCGGFFRGDLVAVGEDDVQRITASIVGSRGGLHAPDVYAAVVRVLLAHEIGHAVQARLGVERRGPRAEREADLTAGWIAESLGWSEQGDARVLQAGGGSGAAASHPSAAERVAAYREGRRWRRARRGG
jgi:hypothetical protein